MADTWSIVPGGIRQTIQLSPTGTGFANTQEITYQITSGAAAGTTHTISVPEQFYTPDEVKRRIDAAVQNTNAIAGL